MAKLRVCSFGVSIDGYGAGVDQDLEHPLGVGGKVLHNWVFPTRTFQEMVGGEGGTTGIDDEFARASFENIGAWILGRNMFGPIRGDWPDDAWKGWWGDNPPYHRPVYVLTHHPRASIHMEGDTTFHFVTDGIEAALERAFEAAGGQDVRLGGGVNVIQQYLKAGLIDEMHLAVAHALLGAGERLFGDIDAVKLGFRVSRSVTTPDTTHIILTKDR